jgi:23S rRNA (uridine2552-2'-O)-methyltransferase
LAKKWLAKNRNDFYHKKSKIEGFRARSAYKLIQINEKFKILHSMNSVLDLGAAPGSWIQVILDLTVNRKKPRIMGVDYKRVGQLPGAKILSLNVFSDKLEVEITKYFENGIDLILSDMAPKISGNKSIDAAKTIDLVMRAYDLALKFMNSGGNFVAKVFQCPEMHGLLKKIKTKFNFAQIHKPKASRTGNREYYVIAKGFNRNRKRD